MNTTTIIIAVLASLSVLVAVTFTLQQIEKSGREKKAMIAALKSQTRNFQFLMDGFPEGFLSRDLKLLVGQCLGDGLDQLLRLESRNPQYQQEKRQLTEKLTQLQALPADQGHYQPLTDAAQIQEVQKLLNSLYNVVQRLFQNKRLSAPQTEQYGRQVQRLATRVALDSHLSNAQQALGGGKARLAIHYYGLAVEKMKKDNADGSYTAQIAAYELRSAELEALTAQQQVAGDGGTPANDEWKAFGDPKDDPFKKKKTVYD